jgi:hypothetical protein
LPPRLLLVPDEHSISLCLEHCRRLFDIVLTDALAAGGDEARRAFEAMMPMKKIDIATIKAARRG